MTCPHESKEDAALLVHFYNKVQTSGPEKKKSKPTCPFCQASFSDVICNYDFFWRIKNTHDYRKVIRDGRKHCQKYHPEWPLWNLIPLKRDKPPDLVQQALRGGGDMFPITNDIEIGDCVSVFRRRLDASVCWIKWCLPHRCKLYSNKDEIQTVMKTVRALRQQFESFSKTNEFNGRIQSHNIFVCLNELQLFFFSPGGYKREFYLSKDWIRIVMKER